MTFFDLQKIRQADKLRRLATVLEDSNDAVAVLDLEGTILAWNKGAQQMYGWTESEALKMNFNEFFPVEQRIRKEMMENKKDTPTDSKLRQRAEKKIDIDGGNTELLSEMSPEEMATQLHELQIHQIELKMQNDELRRIHEELEQSRDKFSHLYDFAPIGYFTMTEKGIIDEANLTLASMLGFIRTDLLGQPFHCFVLKEDQDIFYKHRQRLLETEVSQACELWLEKKGGDTFYARLEYIIIKNKEHNLRQIRVAVNDITERKQTEDELFKYQHHLENIVKERTAGLEKSNHLLQAEVIERKQAEEKLIASLHEKEILLKEIHHRVKNNLQIISSLLNLQANSIKDEQVNESFRESQQRIVAMASVHTQLYKSQNFAAINFADYVQEMARQLLQAYRTGTAAIGLLIHIEEIMLPIDSAIPCGLLINELITNALKYAFPEARKGEITIEAQQTENGVRLIFADNGIGLPNDVDFHNSETLGLRLVQMLVKQLDGSIELYLEKGTRYVIQFKPATAEEILHV